MEEMGGDGGYGGVFFFNCQSFWWKGISALTFGSYVSLMGQRRPFHGRRMCVGDDLKGTAVTQRALGDLPTRQAQFVSLTQF